LHYLGVDF
jgi:glutathione S-transferase